MDYRLLLCKVLTLSFLLFPRTLTSQISAIEARFADGVSETDLQKHFREYRTYLLDSRKLVEIVRDADFKHEVTLDLPGYGQFEIDLFENPLKAPEYLLSVQSENGIENIPSDGIVKTYRGNLKGGQYVVSLTIDEGFVYGFIQLPGKDKLEFEPLRWYVKDVDRDALLVFKASDRQRTVETACGVSHVPFIQDGAEHAEELQHSIACQAIQIAFANDWLMYTDHGSNITDVENHNMGVINDVQNNYDTEFNDDLQFQVTQIWVSTCSTCDPWSNSTNAGTLLNSFTDWGPSGFSNTHDVANLWTNRDFDGITVGIAWLEAVCTPFRYLTTQDFTNSDGGLRSLLAHELGHSFGADHDPSGSQTIMAPSLVVTNTWSTQSITQINDYISGIGCLGPCSSGGQAPVANFGANDVSGCDPFAVQFFDLSTGSPTAWQWTFPGGTPSTSTQQNPTVTYNNPGEYDVALQVSNANGNHSVVQTDYISVVAAPNADYGYNISELTVSFFNLSLNGNSYLWNFGDGETSTQLNPVHTYDTDGEYEVSLTVNSSCGNDTYTEFVEVISLPTADFVYSEESGCASHVVQFGNASSGNAESFLWLFPGGAPSNSIQEYPVVQYNTPGLYSVTLIVENAAGSDQLTVNNLIEVTTEPVAGFNYVVNGLTVQFINSSSDAEEYHWTFGDGTSSASGSPAHVYPAGGTYQVVLEAENPCGTDVHIAIVSLTSAPVAGFTTSISSGCAPATVMYTSTSTGNVTSYLWLFPGGVPSSSNAPSPTIQYNTPGTYDAQLIVGNSVGFDTLFLQDVVTIYTDVSSGFIADVDGNTVDFTNTSTGANFYKWLINGNTYVTEHLTYTFPTDGEYPVRLIATGQCGSDTSIQVLQISTMPTAGIASNLTDGCQALTVQFFNASSANATTFGWEFEGGVPSTSSVPNPVVHYNQPGAYDVQLTVWSAGGGSDVIVLSDLIVVRPLPISAFSTIQTGSQVEFINTSSHGEQYLWLFGDGGSSADVNPVHQYSGFGNYEVMLITENSCGADTSLKSLSITGAPVADFIADLTEGCIPLEVKFTDMSQNAPDFWEWSFPGGNPDTSNLRHPVIVYEYPGYYPVRLKARNIAGASDLVRDEYILVAHPPVAAFTFEVNEGTVILTNQSVGGAEVIWNFGDGTTDYSENPIHIYDGSGEYKVELIVINACSADTVIQEVTVTITATDEVNPLSDIRVYPNPNSGIFTIVIDGKEEIYNLEIFDLVGRSVLEKRLDPNASGRYEITLNDPIPGVYSIVLQKRDFRNVIKIVVL